MKWYYISADGGNTWTAQYMTEKEANDERQKGYIVMERKTGK